MRDDCGTLMQLMHELTGQEPRVITPVTASVRAKIAVRAPYARSSRIRSSLSTSSGASFSSASGSSWVRM